MSSKPRSSKPRTQSSMPKLSEEKWIRRQLISISGDLNQLARDQERKLDDVLNEAQEGLFQLSHNQTQQGFVQMAPIVKERSHRH